MIPRAFRWCAVAILVAIPAVPAVGQTDDRTIEVIDLSGPLDSRLVDFAVDSIERAGDSGSVEVVILQIDSPGAIAPFADLDRLAELVADPPVPVVAWLGPAPAVAQGGVAQILTMAQLRAAAPGTRIGRWTPTVAGSGEGELIVEPTTTEVLDEAVAVTAPIEGLIDLVQPETASIRQLAQLLDGADVSGTILRTIRPFTAEDGAEGVTVLTTVIRQPGLWDRFLRLASTPEAAFFFLVAGLTVAAFEYYAIGPGIAAGVAALCLVIGGYGLAVLPLRWWALGLALVSVFVLAVSYQGGGILGLSALGLVGLVMAGLFLTDAAPQIRPSVPGVLLTVAGAAFFFLLAMPTVARSRFSTQTIGRDDLVGRQGSATADLTPDGEVEVAGARWKATSHREAGIRTGDPVEVVGVDGWFLEVEPLTRENHS